MTGIGAGAPHGAAEVAAYALAGADPYRLAPGDGDGDGAPAEPANGAVATADGALGGGGGSGASNPRSASLNPFIDVSNDASPNVGSGIAGGGPGGGIGGAMGGIGGGGAAPMTAVRRPTTLPGAWAL